MFVTEESNSIGQATITNS